MIAALRLQPRGALRPEPIGEWQDGAACAGHDPDLWDADSDSHAHAQARVICGGCPVLRQCTEWAIRYREAGIWGGLDMMQREELHRRYGAHAGQARLESAGRAS